MTKWKGHNKNALCWSSYYMNDNEKKITNVINWWDFFCYLEPIEACNKITKSRKCLISYYNISKITSLKNHVDVDHVVLYKTFEEEANSFLRGSVEIQPINTCPSIFGSSISNFFLAKNLYKQSNVEQQQFLEDLGPLVVKNNLPI